MESFSLDEESSQMWSLNKRLEAYLSRVKALEEENELLRTEIHHLRKEPKAPTIRKYHEEIMKLRDALDDGHQKMTEAEMARDDIYQEIEHVKDLCLQEKQAQEEVRKVMSQNKNLLEEERRAQTWLKERLVQLEVEMEDILRVHEEEKAAMEEEISGFSRRLDSFKVTPVAFQPVNVEDYSMKLSQIWQGAVEDYKSEVSSLESSLSEAKDNLRKVLEENKQSQLQLQNLDRELQSLRSRKDMLEEVLEKQWLDQQEEEGKLQLEIEALEKEKQELRAHIAQVLEDRQQLMHLKMSLSLEVATYRSLLEAESSRIYSPTADYKLSSPISDSVWEKTPLRKRQNESTKTPVTRDYRLISSNRQNAEKSDKFSHTPSHHLNVKSTSFSSRASPVTKEFQKVSSVLQSQSLKYTKASTEKAPATLSSAERKIERCPPTEDALKKSKVETISYSFSRGSSKATTDDTKRSETKDKPLDKTIYNKNDAELTKPEAVENGFLLPGEKEILESSLKAAKDHHHPLVHSIAMEDQQGFLNVDINVEELQSTDQPHEEKDHLNVRQAKLDLGSQIFENVEAELIVEKEEVVSKTVTCRTVLFEKQEDVQSLEYQNSETLAEKDVEDHRMVQDVSEPFTSDAKAELQAVMSTHEQDRSTTLSAEKEEPLSSDVSEYEPLTQEQDFNGQVSFDLEHATRLSSDIKEDTEKSSETYDEEEFVNILQDGHQISVDAENRQDLHQGEQKTLELCSLEEKSEMYSEQKTQIICVTEQITEQLIVDKKEDFYGPDDTQSENMYLPKTGPNEIQKELESVEFSAKERESCDLFDTEEGTHIFADKVHVSKLASEDATSQLSDVAQDTIQLSENVEDGQDVKLEEQNISKPTDAEQDKGNLEQELDIALSENKQDLNDHDSEYNDQHLNYNDDSEQLLDKSQEQSCDIKQDSSIVPEAEPVDSLQTFQEEQKDIDLPEAEQEKIKLRLDQDSSPSESKEEDVIKVLQYIQQASMSFDAESLKPQVSEEGADPTEIECNPSLQQEVAQQPAKEDSEPCIAPTIANMVEENKSEEIESKDIFAKRQEGRLESSLSADGDIQEPESSNEQVSEAEGKMAFQNESEETNQWTEKVIIQESCEICPQEAENILSEEHEVYSQLVHKAYDPTEEEGSTMTNLGSERFLLENEAEECVSENIESSDRITINQESKDPAAHEDPEHDYESLLDTQHEISQKETVEEYKNKDAQEETSRENYEDVSKKADSNKNVEEKNLEDDQESEYDQQQANVILEQGGTEEYSSHDTEEKSSLGDSESAFKTTEKETVEETEESKTSRDLEANQELKSEQHLVFDSESKVILQQESTEEYSTEDIKGSARQDDLEIVSKTTAQDTLMENEDSKDFIIPDAEQETELDQEEVSDTYPQESIEEHTNEGGEEKISWETVSETVEKYIFEENEEDSKDSKIPEADQDPELDHEPLSSAEAYQLESVLDTGKGTDEGISEESFEVVSTVVENTFEKSEEVDQLGETEFEVKVDESAEECAEQESYTPEVKMEKCVSGSEKTESEAHVNPASHESQETEPEQKTVFDQQPASDIQQEFELQQENADEYSSKDPISSLETDRLFDYEPVSKKLKDPKVDQDLEYDADFGRDAETHGQSCDVENLNQDMHAAVVVEDYNIKQIKQLVENGSEFERDGFTQISTEHENQSSESNLEESVSASDDTQDNTQLTGPEANIQTSFDSNTCPVMNAEVELDSTGNVYEQETEVNLDQCPTSQQGIETKHLKYSGEEEEMNEENYEATSAAEDYNISEDCEKIVLAQKEPEDDQKIPFSLTIIQNNLRFTSENDIEVPSGKQESTNGTKTSGYLVVDETRSENSDLQMDDIEHDSFSKEEDKYFTESNLENENTDEKEEDGVSESLYRDLTFASESHIQIQENQAKYLEPKTNEQRDEESTAVVTESEIILVDHNIEHKLYAEKPAVTDFEGPPEEQSEINIGQTHSNLDEEKSKSEESLDSQDISIYSQKSDDFEISKDYQLEQTLPDSTPLPSLEDEYEDLAEDMVIIKSEEAQNVVGTYFLPELRTDSLDNLSSQSLQIAKELGMEELKQELGDFTENTFGTLDEVTFDNKELEESAENDNTESEESLNSQGNVSISSQKSDHLEASTEYQLEDDSTPLSSCTDGSQLSEPEPPQTDDVQESEKDDIEQSGLAVDQSAKETESVSETTELVPSAEHSELEDKSELLALGQLTEFIIDNKETEDVINISEHDRECSKNQSNEDDEGLENDNESLHKLKGGEKDTEVQETETSEHAQEDIDVITITKETNVFLESDSSLSSDETSPNVTSISQETGPEDDKSGNEETSPDVKGKESSDESEKVGSEKVEETWEQEALLTTKSGQEASLPQQIEFHASDEEKDTTGEISDSSFDSNSGNEREATEEQRSSPAENNIHFKTTNGLHESTIVEATLDLEDFMINGHSTGEQSKIVISELKTIVKVEEDIKNTDTQDIIEESFLKFATSEGKSEGLFQSLLEKSELKEGTRLDESSEIKNTIHSVVEYLDAATEESNYTKKTLKPYLSDSDFNYQAEIKSSLVAEDLIVDKDTSQQTFETRQEKEDSWSSDE